MEILAIVLALHRCNVDEKPVFIVSSVCLSVCLSVCPQKVGLRNLSRFSTNHGDLDRLFDFDIQGQVH